MSPLLDNLDPHSVVARHAVRYALALAAALVVFWLFPKPFGYWTPLTVTVVLKPYAGTTLARAVQRTIGAVVGILIGVAAALFLPTAPVEFARASRVGQPGSVLCDRDRRGDRACRRTSPLADLRSPQPAAASGHLRARNGRYAEPIFAAAEAREDLSRAEAARRRAGAALTDFHASLQRALTEIGGGSADLAAMLQASFALQRLSSTLNALLNAAPWLAKAGLPLDAFRKSFVPALTDPYSQIVGQTQMRAKICASDGSPESAFAHTIQRRLASELALLREGLAPRMGPGDP